MAVEVRGGQSDRPPAARGPVVAVTGAAHGVGAVVARRLCGAPGVGGVIGIDLDPARDDAPDAAAGVAPGVAPDAAASGIAWRTADVREPGVAAALEGVDAVVHLALDLAPDTDRARQRGLNTRGTATVLTAAFAAQVRRVVLMTSAMVYGALPDNPVPLADDAPLRAVPEASVLGDLVEIERLAARSARSHPGMSITVLRPAWLLGPGVESAAAGMFDAPRLLVVRGAQPRWQFCHVDDLAAAVALAVRGEIDGVATVASEGWLQQEQVEAITGRRRLELPASVAYGTAERLHRIGVTPAPPSEIGYLVHPWVVASARLRAAGWTPRYTNEEALRDHLATHAEPRGPRVDARGATAAAGAAGAAVALVGTAALVRRARRRRQPPR